eukprot:4846272-Amphidinium_carterae.1
MYEYFQEENDIGEAQSLHEGVLYWMTFDDIKKMEERAFSNKDPEALQEYKWYVEANQKLERQLREEYEKSHGELEQQEAYQQALQDKD